MESEIETPVVPDAPDAPVDTLADLHQQLIAYRALLDDLRTLLTAPALTPPPTAIGNPAQPPLLNMAEIRAMDVESIKHRLSEVLLALTQGERH